MHSPPSLVKTLQRTRKVRRISQLELSLRLGVSQRHVSFVENGRARPSRDLLVAWLQALDAPLAVSNEALLAAGYAPAYSEKGLDDPWLAEAALALDRLLDTHDPAPALVLDAEWNVVRMNQGAMWLATLLMPATAAASGQVKLNMLDLLTHPGGLGDHVMNIEDVGPRFLWILRNDAAARPRLQPRVAAYEAHLSSRIGKTTSPGPGAAPPVMTTRFASPHGPLAFFSMFTTFGTPNDITLASLRVEHLFPADDATRAVLDRHVARDRA